MADTLLGGKIGHFRVVDKIATGGMGEVYAGFDETLQRKVAIKGIRADHHLDEEAKVRFLREARVLSQLGHPNICQIFDYIEGERSDYIVMELVEGQSLKRALKQGLDDRAKMKVAEQVAGVLVVAHEKGVIHRDLKPENVMLTPDGEVKVLDFGLSRQVSDEGTWALGGEATAALPPSPAPEGEGTMGLAAKAPPAAGGSGGALKATGSSGRTGSTGSVTMVGAVMGTLGYMSPEQARGEVAMAASDMYSFGLLLQELFTGKPPFEAELDAPARLEKARRGETVPASGLDPDLEALVNRLKSLAPGARPSAADTVAKLEWIRLKPQRRRRKLLMTAAAVALALFSVAMTIQSVRATRAERRARLEAETAKQVSAFLTSLFKVSDPSEARGRSVTAREILDKGAKKIDADLAGQPLVQARLKSTMGTVYMGLGLFSDAEPLLTGALALREKNLPANSPDVAENLASVAVLYINQGRYDEAEPLVKRALAVREEAFGPESPEVAGSLNILALVNQSQGRLAEAEPLYKRALAIREKVLGPDHADVAANLNNLGLLYYWQGKYAEALPLFQRALAVWEKCLPPDHPHLGMCLNSLAACYGQLCRYDEAAPLIERALALQEKVLGPDHPALSVSVINLASTHQNGGRYAEAEPLYRRALAIREKALGPDHPDVAKSCNYLALLYVNQGRFAEAEPLDRRSLTIHEKALGPDHPDVAGSLLYLAGLHLSRGRYAEAESLTRRALAILEKALGPDHPDVAGALMTLGAVLRGEGNAAQARPLLERCLAIREKALGPRGQETANTLRLLAACELSGGAPGEALGHAALAAEIGRELTAKMPEEKEIRGMTGAALLVKGRAAAALGQAAEAQASWREALAILQALPEASRNMGDRDALAQVLAGLGRTEEARPLVRSLAACGYTSPDLAALLRERGLAP